MEIKRELEAPQVPVCARKCGAIWQAKTSLEGIELTERVLLTLQGCSKILSHPLSQPEFGPQKAPEADYIPELSTSQKFRHLRLLEIATSPGEKPQTGKRLCLPLVSALHSS